MTVFIVITIFAVVQSLFGIGLLVFGTPTLLLLGYPFVETLAILLPASIAVSLLQVMNSKGQEPGFLRTFSIWCVLPLVLALMAVLLLKLETSLNFIVAIALAAFAMLRLFPTIGEKARDWVARHSRTWLLLMGLVHGLSNLGGGLLTIFAASRYRNRENIRSIIAFCYSVFAAIQLTVLAIVEPSVFSLQQLAYSAVSASIFLLIGQRVFRWVTAPCFDRLLTLFMGSYAGLLGLRSFGLV